MSETEFDEFEEEVATLSLVDDLGNEIHFEVLDEFDYSDKSFIVLLPYEEGDDEVVVLQVIHGDDEDEFLSVEDEKLLYDVFDEFKKRNADFYDFQN